jgi:heme-degrading monooxygenase HmoA
MPIELDDIRTRPPQPVVWITTVEGPAENVERAAGLAHGQLLAVYQGQPGWQGALGLLSFDRRRGLVLSFWESEQALLEGGMANAAQFREGAAAAGVAIAGSERFEILFDERVE